LSEASLDPSTVVLYEGEWRDGLPHGRGVMRWQNGDVYDGEFDNGQPHGSGTAEAVANTFTFADGRVYTGEFVHGLREGKGKLTQPNGDVYDGQFVHGTVTGFGCLRYAKGPRVYQGLFEHGRKVKGHLHFPGSRRGYDGEWLDDVPHGSGFMTFANGDFYKGDFAAGELHGVGCLRYQSPAGKIYYGQFLRGQPCGRGFLYEPEGVNDEGSEVEPTEAKITEGYFRNGQVVPEDDTAAREAVMAATRELRAPEATAPPYASLLQLRPASGSASGLTSFFPGASFSAAAPHSDVSFGTSPPIGGAGPPIHLVPTTACSSVSSYPSPQAAAMGGSGLSSSLPSASVVKGDSFTKGPQSRTEAPTSDGTGDGEHQPHEGDDDDEAIVSATSDNVDIDDADEATAVVAGNTGSPPNSSAAVMPPLTSAGQDGSCRGWLEKCAIGRHNLSLISKWKRRFFILALCNDSVCLGYYEDDLCHKPIGFIRLNTTDTRIVTCPTTKTHKKATRPGRDLCVIYHEKRKEYKLLLRARDTADHDRWATAFRSFFIILDRPSDYPMHAFQS
jgi:hypothetical protein